MAKLKSILLASILAAHALSVSAYEWNPPGQNPYTGSIASAVFSYKDISQPCKLALLSKIKFSRPGDRVYIWNDAISSTDKSSKVIYDSTIWGMHFGSGTKIPGTVTRDTWATHQHELASVYSACGHSIIIPDVCNNVARITTLYRADRSTVSEPSTFALSALALIAALAFRRSHNV